MVPATAASLEGVDATLDYVSARSTHQLRYIGGGREANTGEFERHEIFVRNARLAGDSLTLDTSGFVLARHVSSVDLYDQAGADSQYPGEIRAVLLALTGADRAVLFGPRRRHMTRSSGAVLQGATDVHVDYAAPDARRLAQDLLGPEAAGGMPYRRYMAINIWRSLSPPPQNRPLAVCDARSVVTQSGALNSVILVDQIPPREAMLSAPPPDDVVRRHGFLFHFDPAHRWYYYPDMTRDEILLFKLYDSLEAGPWRCPHTSFADPTVSGVPQRESYEIRSFVYFK